MVISVYVSTIAVTCYLGMTEFYANINSCLSPTPYPGMSSHDKPFVSNQDK